MEETNSTPEPTSGMTFLKGLALILGGAALGFFGCLGGLGMGSIGIGLLMLAIGAGVILWGIGLLFIALFRAVTKN